MAITLIQTGGTIDKDYPKSIKGWAFEIGEPAFLRIIEKLPNSKKWEIIPLLKKDSTELTAADRNDILTACKKTKNTQIIITHGTDTLLETAKSLATLKNKTIVITGAMRPERFSNSDAELNFGMALAGVQTFQSGIYIAIQGIITNYEKLSRNLETGLYFIK
ncbi:MAG: asparaginase domain-containing protein [Bacteroidales bacterium]|jgi:L-asparaginase|nr:asparaginase domain-containing protein [Bacteroidales bacterium]